MRFNKIKFILAFTAINSQANTLNIMDCVSQQVQNEKIIHIRFEDNNLKLNSLISIDVLNENKKGQYRISSIQAINFDTYVYGIEYINGFGHGNMKLFYNYFNGQYQLQKFVGHKILEKKLNCR